MNRFNVIALAMLTVAGNVVAMEQKPEAAPKMQRMQDAFKDAALVVADKANDHQVAVGTAAVVAGTGALVLADRKLNKGRIADFATHQLVRLFNAAMANKSTSVKAAVAAAVLGYLGKWVYDKRAQDLRYSFIAEDVRFKVQDNLTKALVACGILGHLYGDKVVAGAKAAWGKAPSAAQLATVYRYLADSGLAKKGAAAFAKAGAVAAKLAQSRAGQLVAKHPVAAGVVAAGTVAGTAAVVYATTKAPKTGVDATAPVAE